MNRRDALTRFDATAELTAGTTLLEASAGTGKTHQITNLALRLVAEHGVPLPAILVVTFTRAATSELRDRVRRRLGAGIAALERALAHPGWEPDRDVDDVLHHLVTTGRAAGELRLRLERLVTAREEFDDATIATIHGFCQETLRHRAFESDVDLEAELIEALDDLLEEVVHDFVVRELRGADDDWYAHLRAHKVDRADLLDLARKLEAEPHLRVVPGEHPDDVTGDPADPASAWAETVGRFRAAWGEHRDAAVDWLRRRAGDGSLGRKHIYSRRLDTYLATVDAWCEGRAAAYADVLDEAHCFTAGELRARTGDAYDDNPVFAAFGELCAVGGQPATAFKVRFARHLDAELRERKRARNVLSFTDLLRALREGLSRPGTRDALREALAARFQAALIDEFQDTDPVQWAIFDTVFGEHGPLHLIGDPKQAIYAFRGADVHTYLAAAGGIEAQRTLETNWRSDAPYVTALNHLFGDGEREVLGHHAIPYIPVDAAAHHREPRLTFPDGARPPLEIVHVPRELAAVEATKNITSRWADRHLPAIVAAEIVAFLRSGAVLTDGERQDGQPREVLPRDVAVLTRTNDQARRIQAALREAGVHAVTAGGGSVYESAEAEALQRLLNGLLRPQVDRHAKAALATPLLGVRGHELAGTDEASWEAWVGSLAAWAGTWREHGVAETARHVFDEAGVRARLLALPSGERILTNVLHLLELLHDAERREQLGPSALLTWLGDRRADPPRDQHAAEIRLESDEDAVTVVTVHRAKGLEYPVVWCPWLWKQSQVSGRDRRNLRFHDDDGALALDVSADTKAPPKAGHLEIAAREAWEESLRLAYVALTRARHRCTVHWGALYGFGGSPLGRILHGWDLDTPTNPAVTDAELRAHLEEIAGGSEGTISVGTAVDPDGARHRPPAEPVEDLDARGLDRDLDRRWQRTSFSRLTRRDEEPAAGPHGIVEGEARDVDAATEPSLRDVAARAGGPDGEVGGEVDDEPTAAEVPLARFPRGPAAGTFLHDVLERLDFTRAEDELDALLADQQARHGLEVAADVPLADGLRAVVDTPLGPLAGGARLADVGPADRLTELSFDLPLAGGYAAASGRELRLDRLAELLGRYVDEVPLLGDYLPRLGALGARPARGFLTGSIDLVLRLRVDGRVRYLVADHKSNWLGQRGLTADADRSPVSAYHPDVLAEQMAAHHYVLQALLYLVGLHRLLRWRLGDAYDYDTDVGGVVYLFLRGMVGADTPLTAAGEPHGVFALRPPAALVDDLDALLARGGVAR